MGLIFYIAMGSTVFLLVALLLAPVLLRPSRAARRMLEKAQSTRPDVRNVRFKEQLRGQIISVAEGLQSKVGLAEAEQTKQKLLAGGIRTVQGRNAYNA